MRDGRGARRRAALFLVACSAFFANPRPTTAQDGEIVGVVEDSTGTGIAGVQVDVSTPLEAPVGRTVTDAAGAFTLRSLASGEYVVKASRLDFETEVERVRVVPGEPTRLELRVVRRPVPVEPVVVSASRTREGALGVPAAVSVVPREEIEAETATSPLRRIRTEPGIEYARLGLAHDVVEVRGLRGAIGEFTKVLTDFRESAAPSVGQVVPSLIPMADADLERIEVIRGPGAAIYGPDADRGVVHFITRTPLEAQGTTANVAFGERELVDVGFRHATKLAERWGVSVSAEALRGRDWRYEDPVESQARDVALQAGADPDTLLIGRRDPETRTEKVVAQLEWRPAPGARWILSGGWARFDGVALTDVGAAQSEDFGFGYLQSRFESDRWFANAYVNRIDGGETYGLRSGFQFEDRSLLVAGQLQRGFAPGVRTRLLLGVDGRYTIPRTDHTAHGRNEGEDEIAIVGSYAHLKFAARPWLDLLGAVRLDWHDRMEKAYLSPRIGLVAWPGEEWAVRFTWNRAFRTPAPARLFDDLVVGRLAPLPYDVRFVGTLEGLDFRRDCAGSLCMRSPFTPQALGGPTAFLPAEATALWPIVVGILAEQGIDPSGLPAPGVGDVETLLATLDLESAGFVPVDPSEVADLPPYDATFTNAVELGYRGRVGGPVWLDVDLYRNDVENFFGPARVQTPNVFFDPVTLEAYLERFLTAEQAGTLAAGIAQIPLGTITPEGAKDPADLLLLSRQAGSIAWWGTDVAVAIDLDDRWRVSGSWSWVSGNRFERVGGLSDILLNIPRNRASLSAAWRADHGLYAGLRARFVESFDVLSGVYRGRVDSYAVADVTLGADVPGVPGLDVTLRATNLLDGRHREFVGAPEIGRLIVSRLRYRM